MSYIKAHQIVLPKYLRDNLTIEDENTILGMIEFAYGRGYESGYNDGWADCEDED